MISYAFYAVVNVSLENGDKRTMFINCDTNEINLVYSSQDATAFDSNVAALKWCRQHANEVYDKVLKCNGSEAIKYIGMALHKDTITSVHGKVVGYRYMYISATEYTDNSVADVFVAYNDGKITFVKDVKDALSFTMPTTAKCWLADHNVELMERYDVCQDATPWCDLVDRETGNRYIVRYVVDEDSNFISRANIHTEW